MSRANSASTRPGGSSQGPVPAAPSIPASAKKIVQNLKEIVPYTEEEIYATLRECNMDPNDTIEKLMHQDPFEEVKRKRDKKRDGGPKDSADQRTRAGGAGRSGRAGGASERGAIRSSTAKYDAGGGRARSVPARENGIHPSSKNPAVAPPPAGINAGVSTSYAQNKPFLIAPSSGTMGTPASVTGLQPSFLPPSGMPGPGTSQLPQAPAAPTTGLSNGSSLYSRVTPGSSSWGSGATMADIVKANGPPPAALPPATIPPMSVQANVQPPVSQSPVQAPFLPSSSSMPTPEASMGVYSSSLDPVLHPSLDPRAAGPPGGAIKRDVGTVGNQRPIGERPVASSSPLESSSAVTSTVHPSQAGPTSSGLPLSSSGPVDSPGLDDHSQVQLSQSTQQQLQQPSLAPAPAPPSLQQESAPSQQVSAEVPLGLATRPSSGGARATSAAAPVPVGASSSRLPSVGSHFNGRPVAYQPHQQPVGPPKSTAPPGIEWQGNTSVGMSSELVSNSAEELRGASGQDESEAGSITSKIQSLSVQEDKPVIIPGHLQVPEADQSRLSFGSFGSFGTSFGSGFGHEDVNNAAPAPLTSSSTIESSAEPVSSIGTGTLTAPPSVSAYSHQAPSGSTAGFSGIANDASAAPASQAGLSKLDSMMQQQPAYPYAPGIQTYPFGLMPQLPGQYTSYDTADAAGTDISRLANLGMQPYTDPASYYTPAFRPSGADEARYGSFPITSGSASGKYSNSAASSSASQGLPSSHEGLGGSATGQGSQSAGLSQSTPGVPPPQQQQQQQPPLPMPAFTQPAGIPLGYSLSYGGYQYAMPPNYGYTMHSPYPNYAPSNSAYPQAPAGNSYPPVGASNYPSAPATAGKLPLPAQYKTGAAAGGGPFSGTGGGYASYPGAPSGYHAGGPVASAGAAAGYEDVSGSQYKDSNLYIPSQMTREMAAGMPGSSYYNLAGQNTAYAHSQQAAHSVAAYGGGMYPSGPAGPTGHQLLQQPQPMGSSSTSGQAAPYQQQQRAQQSWNSNY